MIKFTPEEINLCEQIAEKHRRNLKIGMYVWRKFCKSVQLIYKLDKEDKEIYTVILKGSTRNHLYWNNMEGLWLIPLWTISDCLEFLQEKTNEVDVIELWRTGRKLKWFCRLENHKWKPGKTPLEACLKAVLAILEEKK